MLHEEIPSICMSCCVIGHFFAACINESFEFADGVNTRICICHDYESLRTSSLQKDASNRIGIVCRSMSRMWGKMPLVHIVLKRCNGIRFNWATTARQAVRRTADKYYAVLPGRSIFLDPNSKGRLPLYSGPSLAVWLGKLALKSSSSKIL